MSEERAAGFREAAPPAPPILGGWPELGRGVIPVLVLTLRSPSSLPVRVLASPPELGGIQGGP